jgi:hypothetical protein
MNGKTMAPGTTIIALAGGAVYDNNDGGTSERLMWRPKGTRLDNEGCWYSWMDAGETYNLAHDGVGWTVVPARYGRWVDGHVRRLASETGELGESFIGCLPGLDGSRVELDQAASYSLRAIDGHGELVNALVGFRSMG